uniref:MIR domain-containing protein n=1 Tax=Globisporangium ultimum (strain ATCC 200006 / CBS 805.95 / DAOM BR144) TaxID=431595 RepID=K3X1Y8_GLOUD
MTAAVACAVLLLDSAASPAHAHSHSNANAHCVRWRATGGCDPHGVREPHNDAACSKTIASGLSGYCECEDRRRVREVTCDHHDFNCEEACAEDSSADLTYPTGFEYVTCGSSIKLVHEQTRFRLHSHEIAYGGGSGQQSITAHGSRNDRNSYWLVKEGDGEAGCVVGDKIQCDAKIRLEHVPTRRNLHTHNFGAPLTVGHDEVSGFGVAGEGDALDTWIVECEESKQCSAADQCEDDGQWKRGEIVRLKSAGTGKYLVTGPHARFDDSNCPRCPINGQQEVSATSEKRENSLWFAGEGIYVTH